MRKLIMLVLALSVLSLTAEAQILKKLGDKIERKVKRRVERKTDETIDKGLDKVEDAAEGKKGEKEKREKDSKPAQDTTIKGSTEDKNINQTPVFSAYSKFDFIPGEQLLFYDDFSIDNVGDFPVKWNTNGSGEVVTLSGQEGRWLEVPDNTITFPMLDGKLPLNFTIEFDLFYPAGVRRPPINFGFSENSNPAKGGLDYKKIFSFRVEHFEERVSYNTSVLSGRGVEKEYPTNKMAGQPVHVSISVNGQRIRLYLNENKMFDLPRAFEPDILRNNFHFRASPLIPAPEESFYIANFRIAEGETDLRSKLITEGHWTTTGILFNVNSAEVRPQSYGVLKEVAKVLNDNPDVKVQIIGHTDSDGAEDFNLKLSQERAASVKNILSSEFGIAAERMETDGQGEAEPVEDNATAKGKAQNRRVEFVKL